MAHQISPNRAIGAVLSSLTKTEDDLVTMLAAVPTHLDEGNTAKVKKMAKVHRDRLEKEAAFSRAKLHAALKGISAMQKEIGHLKFQLKQKEKDIDFSQAISMIGEDSMASLSASLSQEDMFADEAMDKPTQSADAMEKPTQSADDEVVENKEEETH